MTQRFQVFFLYAYAFILKTKDKMNERGSLLESPYPSQFSDFPKKSQNILKPSGIL